MESLHLQVAVLVADEKLNCFYFCPNFFFKTTRDNFHPGPADT